MVETGFFDRVLATIRKYQMLTPGDRVLVAVSGGPDSIALLHLLKEAAPLYRLTLNVFHLNHKIRGAEAGEDARFVEQVAGTLGVPAILKSFDVPELMAREKLSLEEAAREARYRLIEEVCAERGCDKVALGHHADDQVETFLMRLIRGAGLTGLSAMTPVRGHYIRPFIEISKSEVLQYIEAKNLLYRLDASNEDESIFRNRVRRELVPLLAEYNPQITSALLKTIELVQEDQAHLEDITRGIFDILAETSPGIVRIPIQGLLAQATAVQRRIVRRSIEWVKGDLKSIEFKHVEAVLKALKEPSVRFEQELPGQFVAFIEYEQLVFGAKHLFGVPAIDQVILTVPGVTRVEELGVEIEAQLTGVQDLRFEHNGHLAHIDADTVSGELILRLRKPGDSFRPFGMDGEKKLQDFFVDEKIPKRKRDWVPIIESGGRIVWVAGFRIDDRVKVTETTKTVLLLKMRHIGLNEGFE